MIFKKYRAGSFETNNYLLIDEASKEACLIDCSGSLDDVAADIEQEGATLKYILLTHGHFDHIAGCNEFKARFNSAKLCLHKADNILIDNVGVQCALFGMPNVKKPVVDEFIDEKNNNKGDLKLGESKIEVIETPGHTLGGLSFMIDGKLFSGDTLFFEEIGRCDLPGGSFKTIGESIKNKLFTLPDEMPVYPGHGLESTVGHEKEDNAYFGRNAKYS